MKRLACANLKGGVGKSTTTLFVAEHWAITGRRVLVVDLDPQASTSHMLLSRGGVDQAKLAHKTVPHLFEDARNGAQQPSLRYIQAASDLHELHDPGHPGHVKVLPAVPMLWFHEYDFDRTMHQSGRDPVAAREEVLSNFLAGLDGHFDVVLFDCPPGFSSLSRCALKLADLIVAPTLADEVSVQSLGDFRAIGLNMTLNIPNTRLRVIVQKFTQTIEQRHMIDLLRQEYAVVEPAIPLRAQVLTATSHIHNVRRRYAEKYGRPLLRPLAPHIKQLSERLGRCIFTDDSN